MVGASRRRSNGGVALAAMVSQVSMEQGIALQQLVLNAVGEEGGQPGVYR
jgi:hypothetical protein